MQPPEESIHVSGEKKESQEKLPFHQDVNGNAFSSPGKDNFYGIEIVTPLTEERIPKDQQHILALPKDTLTTITIDKKKVPCIVTQGGVVLLNTIMYYGQRISDPKEILKKFNLKKENAILLTRSDNPDEYFENAEEKPKEWKVCSAWAKDLSISPVTLQKYINKYLTEHPELKVKKTAGGHTAGYKTRGGVGVNMCYSPHLIELVKQVNLEEFKKRENAEKKPDDWKTCGAWRRDLDVGRKTLQNYIDDYLIKHPELKGKASAGGHAEKYKGDGGKVRTYYSPNLIELVKQANLEEFKKRENTEKKPDDWKTCWAWRKDLDVGRKTLQKYIDDYLAKHPLLKGKKSDGGHAAKYKDERGYVGMCYSPHLIDLVRQVNLEEFKKRENAEEKPERWKTCTAWIEDLENIDNKTLKNYIDNYLAKHPLLKGKESDGGHAAKYKTQAGVLMCYSPHLIELVKQANLEEFKKRENAEKAPESWKTCTAWAKDLKNIESKTLQKYINTYLTQHPKLKGKESAGRHAAKYRARGGINMHYSPYLIELVKQANLEEFKKRENAEEKPKTWKTCNAWANDLGGVNNKTFQRYINNYLAEYPELKAKESAGGHAEEYKDETGYFGMHYSPHLIDLVKAAHPDKFKNK